MPSKKTANALELQKAWSVDNIQKKVYKTMKLSEPFYNAFGLLPTTGLWFIWGASGSGKSSFMYKLIKELANFEKIGVNDLEEGADQSVQDAFKRFNIAKIKRRLIWCCETMKEMDERMSKPKSPNVWVINSFQYTGMSFEAFLAFKRKHHKKLIIVISQADGKQPEGRTARKVKSDAALKIWVEGYVAFSKGRYIGNNGGTYTVWLEGSELYHGTATQAPQRNAILNNERKEVRVDFQDR